MYNLLFFFLWYCVLLNYYVEWEDWDSTGAILGLDRWEQDWDNSDSFLVRKRELRGGNLSKKSSMGTHSAKATNETIPPYESSNKKGNYFIFGEKFK
jgi:hypothetical protein